MSEAIETAAKAICVANGDDPEREGPFKTWVRGSAYERQAQAAIAAYLAAMEAEGFVMVPVEPSEEMVEAGVEQFTNIRDIWSGMIAARPKVEP